MSKGLKRAHHTVPKMLLSGFADERNRLSMRRRDGTQCLISTTRATVRRDFYSFVGPDNALVDTIETWLGDHVEGPFAETLRRLQDGEQPQAADSSSIAAFAAAGLLRTMTVRSYFDQIDAQMGPTLILMRACAKAGVDPSTLTRDELSRCQLAATLAWNRGPRETNVDAKLRTFLRKLDGLTQDLTMWTWTVQTAESACLITADSPVATRAPDDVGWHGILPAGSPVLLPISPYRLIVGSGSLLGGDVLEPQLARLVNRRLAREASDAIFAHPSMGWPDDLELSRHPPTLPTPSITWSRSAPGTANTFPARYPRTSDPSVAALLDSLGAVDIVE